MILHFYDGRWLLTGAKPSDDSFVSGLLCCRAALLLDETRLLAVPTECQGLSNRRECGRVGSTSESRRGYLPLVALY